MRHSSAPRAVFLLCLALGIAAGLAFAWLIAPSASPSGPDRLNAVDRDLYLRLVAAAYATDSDRARAEARLAATGPGAVGRLGDLVALDLAEGRSPRAVAQLAADLGLASGGVPLLAPPRALPPATAPPGRADIAASPTPRSITLLQQQPLCDGSGPRLQAWVVDERSEPLTGVILAIRWDGGRSTAFTGFSRGNDAGSADFLLQPGVVYELEVDSVVVVADLAAPTCPDGQQGGWKIELGIRN